MVTFFTEAKGTLSAVARSARRSRKRFPALEPMHLLRIGVADRPGGDSAMLVESAIARPRLRLVASLDRMDAAGRALRWVRRVAPPHTPEPALWAEINDLLDRLDTPDPLPSPEALLAGMGLRLLAAIGWGLDLTACVRCGRACEPGTGAYVDPAPPRGASSAAPAGARGSCWEGSAAPGSSPRRRGEAEALEGDDVRVALEIVDAALAAHG